MKYLLSARIDSHKSFDVIMKYEIRINCEFWYFSYIILKAPGKGGVNHERCVSLGPRGV